MVDDSSICLINVHLAAGQSHVRQRNRDVAAILEGKALFPATTVLDDPLAYAGGGDGAMVLDHDIVIVGSFLIDLLSSASSIGSHEIRSMET